MAKVYCFAVYCAVFALTLTARVHAQTPNAAVDLSSAQIAERTVSTLTVPVPAYPLNPNGLAEPEVPLTATIVSSPTVHKGPSASLQVVVAFNRPVPGLDKETTSVQMEGGTVESIEPYIHAGEQPNSYMFIVKPSGLNPITFRLVADEQCSTGICTADGNTLSISVSAVIALDATAPTVSTVRISSNPGPDRTYATGDEIQVAVTFNETVEVDGTPRLQLELGGSLQTAAYRGGGGAAALVFGYEVAEGDEDSDGVSVEADSLLLDGGMIRDGAGNAALLGHEGLGDDPWHTVDGIRPVLEVGAEATVKGDTLMLTFAEALDGSSIPVAEDFRVMVEGEGRDVSEVVVGGSTVRLSLASAVEAGDAVSVSYASGTEEGAQPIRDVAGNGAAGFTEQAVTNRTGNSGDRAGGTLPLRAVRQIEALLARKAERTPAQRKVSSRLLDAGRETLDQAAAGTRRDTAATDAPEGLVTVDIRAGM